MPAARPEDSGWGQQASLGQGASCFFLLWPYFAFTHLKARVTEREKGKKGEREKEVSHPSTGSLSKCLQQSGALSESPIQVHHHSLLLPPPDALAGSWTRN